MLDGTIDVTGGAGEFVGATDKGSMRVTLDPETGKGMVVLQANIQ